MRQPREEDPGKSPSPMHPAFVHFPITLFPLSAVFLLLWYGLQNPFFLHAAYWSFLFGSLIILPVVLSGFLDMRRTRISDQAGHRTMDLHLRMGLLTAFLSTITGAYFLLHNPTVETHLIRTFSAMSFLLALMVLVQGVIGGIMVYTYKIVPVDRSFLK